MTVGGLEVTREERETRQVTVVLSRLAVEGLTSGTQMPAPAAMEGALRYYLGDRGSGRPAWPYPAFLRGSETKAEAAVELDLDRELWSQFEEEADHQGVSVEQLAEHAAFYFAAELDAGRVTQRILDEFEQGESGPGA
jgi:hypothetical protein